MDAHAKVEQNAHIERQEIVLSISLAVAALTETCQSLEQFGMKLQAVMSTWPTTWSAMEAVGASYQQQALATSLAVPTQDSTYITSAGYHHPAYQNRSGATE